MKFAACHPERKHNSHGKCNSCSVREWQINNPEKYKAQIIGYRLKNKTRITQKASEYRKKHPDRFAAYNRQRVLQSYGLTIIEYNLLLEKQNGLCAICNKVPPKKKFYIDHNHITGQVRGLLCQNCNFGLGHFKDNSVVVYNAMKYLQGSQI